MLSKEQLSLITETVEKWRRHLQDISWFMRCLNEHIARLSNFEDQCKGRLWEGRFKSQALLDEHALLTCMAYGELNPLRAQMANTAENSDYTSIKQRIDQGHLTKRPTKVVESSVEYIQLKGFLRKGEYLKLQLPFSFPDYLLLVDWNGRAIRDDKRGVIKQELPPILYRLGIDEESWIKAMQPKGNRFSRAMGCCDRLRAYAKAINVSWIKGTAFSAKIFPNYIIFKNLT